MVAIYRWPWAAASLANSTGEISKRKRGHGHGGGREYGEVWAYGGFNSSVLAV